MGWGRERVKDMGWLLRVRKINARVSFTLFGPVTDLQCDYGLP